MSEQKGQRKGKKCEKRKGKQQKEKAKTNIQKKKNRIPLNKVFLKMSVRMKLMGRGLGGVTKGKWTRGSVQGNADQGTWTR